MVGSTPARRSTVKRKSTTLSRPRGLSLFGVGGRYAVTMHPALIVVYALAVARVTRLLVEDRILDRPRNALLLRAWDRATGDRGVSLLAMHDPDAEKPLAAYLMTCPWCVSIYVGAVAAPLAYFWGSSPWLLIPALALAFSYTTGWLASKE